MELQTLPDVRPPAPFRPFDTHAEDCGVRVGHAEQVFVTPDPQTVIMTGRGGGRAIPDLEHLRSLCPVPRRRRQATGPI